MKGHDVLMQSGNDTPGSLVWETPDQFFAQVERELGVRFTLDVCATKKNAKVPDNYFTKRDNALKHNIVWDGNWWCNPPYGDGLGDWVTKGAEQARIRKSFGVMLLPARTDTKWFHEVVWREANHVFFVQGRIKFKLAGKKNSATFPSLVVVFDGGGRTQWSGRINGGPHISVLKQEKAQ